jgi:hypothetical protein
LCLQPQKEWSLTFSSNWDMDTAEFRNNRWFLSFQMTLTHNSQMSCKQERLARRPPREWINCKKWSDMVWGSTEEMSIQNRTNDQRSQRYCNQWKDAELTRPRNSQTHRNELLNRWYLGSPNLLILATGHTKVSKQTLTF